MKDVLPSTSQLSSQNPWPGLRAFTEADCDFFFGRERETADLVNLIRRASVVVLYGQSGLGKTSLLQAAIFPELKRIDFLPFRLRFDQAENAAPIATQIKLALTAELDRAEVTALRPAATETLWEYFHRRNLDFWGPRNRLLTPVIVLDQFEEVFTVGQRDENTSGRVDQFISDLEALLEHRPPEHVRERLDAHPDDALQYDLQREDVKFVISLREDFLPHLDTWRVRMPSLLPHRFRLEHMTGSQALEAVLRAGREIVEPEVARDIVDFVSSSQRKRGSRAMEQRDVEPALLSVVCDELNRRRLERDQMRITADLLSGEREAIIQTFYERAFEGLDNRVRDWVEDELLTGSGYRDRGALEDALRLGLSEAAFDQLVDQRILHREEREGVVWLELTHDLLSDPAAQSRALRQQRRQAEAAARREVEYADQLGRTRRLVAIFGVLLAIAAAAFVLAFVYFSRAKNAQRLAQDNADKAGYAERNAKLREQEAKKARETAEENLQFAEHNFTTALRVTEGLGLNPIRQIAQDLRAETATVLNMVTSTDKSYENLSANSNAPAIIEQHAHFLAIASDVLFQMGQIKKGLDYSRQAINLLERSGTRRLASSRFQHYQAEAYFARARGFLLTGQLRQSRADFERARNLATIAAGSNSDGKHDMSRVQVLAEIGLGEAATKGWELVPARAHFDQALNFIATNHLDGNEADSWRALAIRGKGIAQTDDVEALRLFKEAAIIAKGLVRDEPMNLRWQRLSAELESRQGFSAYRLSRYEDAEHSFERGKRESENLCNRDPGNPGNRDPGNLDWCLLMAQNTRGLGLVYEARREFARWRGALESFRKETMEVTQQQPSWAQADYMYVSALMDLGDLEVESNGDLNKAWAWFTQAGQKSRVLVKEVPEYLDFDRMLALCAGRQGGVRSDQGKDEDALKLYLEAVHDLQPIDAVAKNDPDVQRDRAWYYSKMGEAFQKLKRTGEAISSYGEEIRIWTEQIQKNPDRPASYYSLSQAYAVSGYEYLQANDPPHASSQYEAGLEAIGKAIGIVSTDTGYLRQKALIHWRIADIRFQQADFGGSLDAIEQAASYVWKGLEIDHSDKFLNQDLDGLTKFIQRIKSAITQSEQSTQSSAKRQPDTKTRALFRRINAFSVKWDRTKFLKGGTQRSWVMTPLVPGGWRILSAKDQETALHELGLDQPPPAAGFTPDQVISVRKLTLDFYDDAVLYELEIRNRNRRRGLVAFVRNSEKSFFLDGTSTPIHAMNGEFWPKLDNPDRALAYLRFFVGALGSTAGRFKLVEQPEDLRWIRGVAPELRKKTIEEIKPLVIESTPNSGWQAIGTVQYFDTLFYTGFSIYRDGSVEMTEDSPIDQGLPVFIERFAKDGMRTQGSKLENLRERIEDDPNDENALQQIPQAYSELKRWKEAAEAEVKWIEFVEHKEKDADKRRESLRGKYTSLSWYQLFAKNFLGALDSSDAGLKLDDSYLPLETKRAHALLFLGRVQEAQALYVKYRGQIIGTNSHKTWEQVVLEDFDALEKEGITSPEMARIRKLLDQGAKRSTVPESSGAINISQPNK